ncbi:hypothetical protein MKZ38_003988 [Zalerion maritima]|uniref:NAD(P)-binding domain-containing protein n=1 Tax=Zalerion maritima TaxID=339359 RepID=A0AAD5RNG5_9PEZI|nr:hypothetical protein MKZ38_003988 [Zalerion maritima]
MAISATTYSILVVPASTRAGAAAISSLLSDPRKPVVTGVYADLDAVPAGFLANPDFKAVKGDVCDGGSLGFEGADAVLAITPPRLDGENLEDHARTSSENVRDAVMGTRSVKRLAYLSSLGAQFENGVGEIRSNHIAESILSDSSFEVIFIRSAPVMESFFAPLLSSLGSGGGGGSPGTVATTIPAPPSSLPLVSLLDVGDAARDVLLARFSGAGRRSPPTVLELRGPRPYSTRDVEDALAEVTGDDVRVETVKKERLGEYFLGEMKMPVNLLPEWVEWTRSLMPGGVLERVTAGGKKTKMEEEMIRRGDRGLVEVLRGVWEEGRE